MSGTQIVTGWLLIAVVFGLFMCAVRHTMRLNIHLERLDMIQHQRIPNIDNRLAKNDVSLIDIDMGRIGNERFNGIDGHISNHETRLCSQFEHLKMLDGFRSNADDRLVLLTTQIETIMKEDEARRERGRNVLQRIDKVEADATSLGESYHVLCENHKEMWNTTNRLGTDSADHVSRIEALEKADVYAEWRRNVGERLGQLDAILNGLLGRINNMQTRINEWPPELRSEIAEAYRRMADAVEGVEIPEVPLYEG